MSELYQYDQLDRLTSFKRGVLSATNDAVASPTLQQSWTLDARGNQTGTTTVARTFNEANETTSVGGSTAAAPTYDAAENTVQNDGRSFVYDAWGRLKRIAQGATTLASHAYDALRGRIVETSAGGTADVYFDGAAAVEERVGGTAATQYVHGATGALMLRDSLAGARSSRRPGRTPSRTPTATWWRCSSPAAHRTERIE